MGIQLLTVQIKMMQYMKKYPCSVGMVESLLQLDMRWKAAYYLHQLEDLELIEDLTQEEVDAFMRGENYKELETCGICCGRYALTDAGEIALDRWEDLRKASIKEVLVPVFTTVLGAVLGLALSGLSA